MVDSAANPAPLNLPALEHALRQVDPAVVLLPSWLLENVIAADRALRGPMFSIPHDRTHVIERDRLLRLADEEDLPLPAAPPIVPVLLLVARPDNDWLAAMPPPQVLLAHWRVLFHARVDALMRAKRESGALDERGVQRRIERLGRA